MKSRLEVLKEEIAYLEQLQATCDHEWQEPIRDVFEKKVEVVAPTRSNPYNTESKEIEYVSCYSRYCPKCGKKEYAFELEDITEVVGKRPKF